MRPFASASEIILYPILEERKEFAYSTEWEKKLPTIQIILRLHWAWNIALETIIKYSNVQCPKYPNDFGFEYNFHDNETLEKQLPSKCKNLESHRTKIPIKSNLTSRCSLMIIIMRKKLHSFQVISYSNITTEEMQLTTCLSH